ncbi:L-fucose/L-arabinose isomerase family protein [Candidatus Allofournierella merdipullorum]|uniref:L-fucose/L-arabinose isomerase family protein n=1 Tax=Candidatus Allofournierella merdipullorum TaxID=2838595 RepID=UPI002A8BF9E1|nr:fucose isomerase [Candidatus Fournierella merdipullorum]
MKKALNVGFVVTVSGRWPRELPEKRLREYGDWVENNLLHTHVFRFPRLVCTHEDMNECIAYFSENKVDMILLVYGAFTGDDIACGLADACRCPIVLWAPREEKWERQDRLYANALCCAAMNGASLVRLHAPHHVVFGNKEEERVKTELENLTSAYAVIKNLQGFTFGLFGYRPTAFYNCAFDEVTIRRTFGINFEETDLKVVFDAMAALPWSEVEAEMARVSGKWDVTALPDGHLENHARLYLVLKELVKKQGYDYSSIKCWPEMGNLHTTPCAVLGRLADEGVGISCEGDIDAGLAAIVQNMFCGQPAFITDLINIDEDENTVTFWHCGNAAPSLHNEADGVTMCNHPLAGQGTAFWCSLKSGPVTAARFTNIDGQYRLFLLRGEAVPTQRNTRGAMVNVKVKTPVLELVQKIAESGMSHHYSVVWQDVADKMVAVAKLLNIPVVEL